MEGPSRKQLEFFGVLIFICTATAGFILLVDFQIKAAILEESNKLRRTIEQNTTRATVRRAYDNDHHNFDYPADLVRGRDSGLEAESVVQASNGKSRKARQGAPEPSPDTGASEVQD